MPKFSTNVIEPRFSQSVNRKGRFPRVTRRFPTSATAVEGNFISDLAHEDTRVISEKPEMLRVHDIMSTDVISVSPDTSVQMIAEILSRNRISSVSVVDVGGRLLGLVREGDLIARAEIGTESSRSWWKAIFYDAMAASHDYVRSHGRKARDVMTLHPHIATSDEPLPQVARRMSRKRLQGMPVVRDERVVGMLCQSDFVRILADGSRETVMSPELNDDAIRERLMARIRSLPWSLRVRSVNATVENGIVQLYGWVGTEIERRALHIVAENTPGVSEVQDHLHRARLHM
jgi:CBS domain-containing protein